MRWSFVRPYLFESPPLVSHTQTKNLDSGNPAGSLAGQLDPVESRLDSRHDSLFPTICPLAGSVLGLGLNPPSQSWRGSPAEKSKCPGSDSRQGYDS